MTLEQINQREDKENASFLKWIKSPSFQLQSHESRTTYLELYMISKNREIGDLQSEIEALRKQVEGYNELIYAVSRKHADETRHQTALRCIQQAENNVSFQHRKAQNEHRISCSFHLDSAGSNRIFIRLCWRWKIY